MSRGRKQLSPSARASEEVGPKPNFELRFTSDAAADIKALDGSVRHQLRKSWRKSWRLTRKDTGCHSAARWSAIGSTTSETIEWSTEFIINRTSSLCALSVFASRVMRKISTDNLNPSPKRGV